MTKVLFLKHPNHGEVMAAFPELKERGGFYLTYAHVGQHSSAASEYLNECNVAAPAEYDDLLEELKGQGYHNLKVLKRKIKWECRS